MYQSYKIWKIRKKARVKRSNTQLNKLKSAANNKTGTTLRITKKRFQDEELPHELLLTTREKIKIRNAFANNMSTVINISRAQLFKIIQSGAFLRALLGKLAGPLMKVGIPLTKNNLEPLAIMASVSAADGAIQRKMHKKNCCKRRRRISL